jgi:cytochrome c553
MVLATTNLANAENKPRKLGLCVGCHGVDGHATIKGYPHLAAQDEEYLYAQLVAFQSGQRDNPPMRASVGSLSEQDMRELARWYSEQLPRSQKAQPEAP